MIEKHKCLLLKKAYKNLRNKRRLTKGLENKVTESCEDEYDKNLDQEKRDSKSKGIFSKPISSRVDSVNSMANERSSKL